MKHFIAFCLLICFGFKTYSQEVFYGLVDQNRQNTLFPGNLKGMNDVDMTVRWGMGMPCPNEKTEFQGVPTLSYPKVDGIWSCAPAQSQSSVLDVRFRHNYNMTDGVTSYDLVLISMHTLGSTPLISPFLRISADANRSNSISTADIVLLRKVILGTIPQDSIDRQIGDSWRFMPKGQLNLDALIANVFIVEEFFGMIDINGNPTILNYPFTLSLYTIPGMSVGLLDQYGFIPEPSDPNTLSDDWRNFFSCSAFAMKVGDVNFSNSYAFRGEEVLDRTQSFTVNSFNEAYSIESNRQLKTRIELASPILFAGGQIGLNFDDQKLTLLNIKAGGRTLEKDEYTVASGKIKIIYVAEGIQRDERNLLYELTFSSNSDFSIPENSDDLLTVDEEFITEFVTPSGLVFPDVLTIITETSDNLVNLSREALNSMASIQRVGEAQRITLLPSQKDIAEATLGIASITGSIVQSVKGSGKIESLDIAFDAPGVYLVTITVRGQAFTKKIVVSN